MGLKTLEAALLKSKEPEWLGCYSTKKLIYLLLGAGATVVWVRLAQRGPLPRSLAKACRSFASHPKYVFGVAAACSLLAYSQVEMRVGEDIAGQVYSTLQWHEGETRAPNFESFPKWENLSESESNWSLRPPVAAWFASPGLWLGLSPGNALRLMLVAFALAGGLGWLLLAERLKVPEAFLPLLGLSLGLSVGSASSSFSTTNSALYGLVPWMVLWAMRIGGSWTRPTFSPSMKALSEVSLFFLLLGFFAWIKLSGMIAAVTVASYPFARLVLARTTTKAKGGKLATLAATGIFFCGPYFALEKINANLSEVSADDMYRSIDYNQQASLWGDHFTESTRGGLLLWSAAAGPGYALPAKRVAHGFRDFMEQFPSVRQWRANYGLNGHALFAGVIGMALSMALGLTLLRLKKTLATESFLLLCLFAVLPFLGLAALSHLHGFNYSLYHAHTSEYATLLALPALLAFAHPELRKKASTTLLAVVAVAIPLSTHAENLVRVPLEEPSPPPSSTERARGLGGHAFSAAISAVEEDSASPDDVLLFLPAGDMGDLLLRTRLRCLAIHFAGDNLTSRGPAHSSAPLNLYCVYSAELRGNATFLSTLHRAFPQARDFLELPLSESAETVALKIPLLPSP